MPAVTFAAMSFHSTYGAKVDTHQMSFSIAVPRPGRGSVRL